MSILNAGRVQPQHKATWNSTTNYIKTDIVIYNGNGYWCIQDNINKQPDTNNSYWSLMVQRGSDADLTQLENSVIYKTGNQTITGGLELTNGVFSSGFDPTALPNDKNGASIYWNTSSPIGGITGGIGRVAAFIKSAAGAITYKTLGLGAYVSNKFSLLLNADGSAVFGGTVTLNSDPTSNRHAATKYYVDYQKSALSAEMTSLINQKSARCFFATTHAISASTGTGTQTISFPTGRFTSAPSVIRIRCVMGISLFVSFGTWTVDGQAVVDRLPSGVSAGNFEPLSGKIINISDATANAFDAYVTNVTKDSFDLIWTRVGAGHTGTVTMQIEVEA